MSNEYPCITIAVLSWNRLHYLKATLESARKCIQYPNIEWIVSDNESIEPGVRDYIQGLDWVDHKIFRSQTHADAMNEIVDLAKGRYLVIWPDDVQFIVEGDWMCQLIDVLEAHNNIGSVGLDALRKSTLEQYFRPLGVSGLPGAIREAYWYRGAFRRERKLTGTEGLVLYTLGRRVPGICGSGIPTLTRTDIWRSLGPWRTQAELCTGLLDSSGGAEVDMYQRFYLSRQPLQTAIMHVPVAADILTDPLGCKAKVRKGIRYGVYMPPFDDQPYYYRIHRQQDFDSQGQRLPFNFTEIVEPIGFELPLGDDGDRLKFSINTSVAFDIEANRALPYPLMR